MILVFGVLWLVFECFVLDALGWVVCWLSEFGGFGLICCWF